jgi:superfamily II DNA/RNA helicase
MASDTSLGASSTTFSDLPLHGDVARALKAMRFLRPSPIQLHALPVALFGNDVIGQAKSGTGKTAVFGVAAIEHTVRHVEQRGQKAQTGDPLALILAPTREIAVQIEAVLRQLTQFRPEIVIRTCIGGLPVAQDQVRRGSQCCVVAGDADYMMLMFCVDPLGCRVPHCGGHTRTREGTRGPVLVAVQCHSTARFG